MQTIHQQEDFFKEKEKWKKMYKAYKKSKKAHYAPGKYFKPRKKEEYGKDKKKYCPKGKKNCRCWICSEEGHYVNECPNRAQYPEKIKINQDLEEIGYEQVEEVYEGTQKVYLSEEIQISEDEEASDSEDSS